MRTAVNACRRLTPAALTLAIAGCTATTASKDPRPAPLAKPVQYESADIRVRLVGVLRAGNQGTLVEDPGWLEYLLAIQNSGRRALEIRNVKLLTREGRYLDSADSHQQITVPPDAASDIAGSVATRAAGAAAGQVVPYGGTIVGIVSSAVSASAAESKAQARRELDRRKLKDVELAPGGKVTGSAFLPDASNARALVLDYGHGVVTERIEIRLPRQGVSSPDTR
jgi:hypothetical protein